MARGPYLAGIALAISLLANGARAETAIVRGFTPRSGPPGTLVKIVGDHFDQVTAVEFGGVVASFRVFSSTHIKATVPDDAQSGPVRVGHRDAGTVSTAWFEVVHETSPGVFAMDPPSPNPGRGTIAWSFALPQAGVARLAVYDVRGSLVRRLVDGWQPSGSHELAWDGTDEARRRVFPGLYFARLEWGGRSLVRRLVVIGG
jgi:hypothetical protein